MFLQLLGEHLQDFYVSVFIKTFPRTIRTVHVDVTDRQTGMFVSLLKAPLMDRVCNY